MWYGPGMSKRKDLIVAATEGVAADLLYYGRKDDEELPRGEIEAAIEAGEITAAEIIDTFARAVKEGAGAVNAALDGHRARVRSGIALVRAALDALEVDVGSNLADRNGAQQVLTNATALALDIARLELLISQQVPE